jgi:hypothetical protein
MSAAKHGATTTHWNLETTKRFEVCLIAVDSVASNYACTGLIGIEPA